MSHPASRTVSDATVPNAAVAPADHWTLEPGLAFLNHGSFGASPRPVLAVQQELRDRMERQPVQFFVRELNERLDRAREALADFLGASADDLVAVPNATYGVNSVLRSLTFAPGDELLTTDHEYNASRNALDFVAARSGARVVVAPIPFPATTPGRVLEAVLGAVTGRTRLALLDHITSPTGLVLPLARLVAELAERGVDTLVDGAHAPGMLPLSLREVGAAYYTGNCHKWLCAPKGAAFLYVRHDRRDRIRPVAISHGANKPRAGRSRFHDEFDWTGTDDPTAFLSVPAALEFLGSLLPGGWPELMEHNRRLALRGREIVAQALEVELPCPEEMIGSLAALPLPDGSPEPPSSPLYADPLQDELLHRFQVEVPVVPWPGPPRRLVRLSAQIYNRLADYERLASALQAVLAS